MTVLTAVGSRKGSAGYELDPKVGIKYTARHRELGADQGRWLSRDPLHFKDGLNLLAYSLGSPVVFADALGTNCTLPSPNGGSGGSSVDPGPMYLTTGAGALGGLIGAGLLAALGAAELHADCCAEIKGQIAGTPNDGMGKVGCCNGAQVICNYTSGAFGISSIGSVTGSALVDCVNFHEQQHLGQVQACDQEAGCYAPWWSTSYFAHENDVSASQAEYDCLSSRLDDFAKDPHPDKCVECLQARMQAMANYAARNGGAIVDHGVTITPFPVKQSDHCK